MIGHTHTHTDTHALTHTHRQTCTDTHTHLYPRVHTDILEREQTCTANTMQELIHLTWA